jgi:hypothetical protein
MASQEPIVCERPCTEKPQFTVGDLRRAIPKHCFERSLVKSSQYLLADLVAVAALVYASTFIDSLPVPVVARAVLWAVYWFFQGAVCTGTPAALSTSSDSCTAVQLQVKPANLQLREAHIHTVSLVTTYSGFISSNEACCVPA